MVIKWVCYWVVLLTLLIAGFLNILNPIVYLPTQSFLPITSETILFVSAIPLSIFESSLAIIFFLKKRSKIIKIIIVVTISIYLFWSLFSYLLNIEIPDSCIARMASIQDVKRLVVKNFILLLCSSYLLIFDKR